MNHLLQTAIQASLAAGRRIMEIYDTEDFEVDFKGDHSPLTKADIASHQIIMSFLSETGIPVLSEEGRHIPYEERKNWRRLWIVDPLDGTKEFIKRNGEFTVNIALVEDGVPVLGVIEPGVRSLAQATHGGRVGVIGTVGTIGAYVMLSRGRWNAKVWQRDRTVGSTFERSVVQKTKTRWGGGSSISFSSAFHAASVSWCASSRM